MEKQAIIEKSRTWIEQFVIGLQLCPFAKLPYDNEQVRLEVCFARETEAQLAAFWQEVERLTNTSPSLISNTILIIPGGLQDFAKYLDLFYLAEQLLADQHKHEQFQLASFHPDYQFDQTEKEDVTNYTNRSPFPFIHILRITEVANAIATHPDIESVPKRNIAKLQELGLEGIKAMTGS